MCSVHTILISGLVLTLFNGMETAAAHCALHASLCYANVESCTDSVSTLCWYMPKWKLNGMLICCSVLICALTNTDYNEQSKIQQI